MKPRLFLPAVLTGPLLWAAFFPLDLGPVAFVALVPWLALVRAPAAGWRVYLAGYVGGLAFFLPATQWFRVAHPMMYFSWLGLAVACPLFWLLGLFLLRRIDRLNVPLPLSVPVVWVALEYARAHFPTGYSFLAAVGLHTKVGFGWYFLGYTQHAVLPLIQVADLGGVYAVSFLVAAVNGVVAEWVLRAPAVRGWLRWPAAQPCPAGRLVPATVAVGLAVAAVVGYGFVRLNHPAFVVGPRVAVLQGNVPQGDKAGDAGSLFGQYQTLARHATGHGADLVVWPETCYPWGWFTVAPGVEPARVPKEFAEVARQRRGLLRYLAAGRTDEFDPKPAMRHPPWRTNVLLGLNGYEWDGTREVPLNTALLVDAAGNDVARYDKMHLVPFGEYVPFRETLPWMNSFTPYEGDYSCRPGEAYTRFPLLAADGRRFTFGCLICYEDSDPYLARQYAGPHEPVDFLVNISNDGWFDGTEEHEQHLAICRFRAVEARRSVVRAVNMGISGVIDPDGRVASLPSGLWAESKKREAVVTTEVPLDGRQSWYGRLGDWLPAACWGLLVVGHVAGMVKKRRAG